MKLRVLELSFEDFWVGDLEERVCGRLAVTRRANEREKERIFVVKHGGIAYRWKSNGFGRSGFVWIWPMGKPLLEEFFVRVGHCIRAVPLSREMHVESVLIRVLIPYNRIIKNN